MNKLLVGFGRYIAKCPERNFYSSGHFLCASYFSGELIDMTTL